MNCSRMRSRSRALSASKRSCRCSSAFFRLSKGEHVHALYCRRCTKTYATTSIRARRPPGDTLPRRAGMSLRSRVHRLSRLMRPSPHDLSLPPRPRMPCNPHGVSAHWFAVHILEESQGEIAPSQIGLRGNRRISLQGLERADRIRINLHYHF